MTMQAMQTSFEKTVIGYFRNWSGAEKTFQDLKSAGFSKEQIGLASHTDTHESGHQESFWDKVVNFFGGHSEGGEEEYDTEKFGESLQYAGVTRQRAKSFEHQLSHGEQGAL